MGNRIIEKAGRESPDTEEYGHRQGILRVMQRIYNQFCRSSSDLEVNVSYEVRAELRGLFEGRTDEEILELLTWNDMKFAFHNSIVECYQLCFAVYSFQFRHYVQRHTKHTPNPSLESISSPLTPQS